MEVVRNIGQMMRTDIGRSANCRRSDIGCGS
jgi:hypothetical protein